MGGAEAEQEVPVGRLRTELPPHHVGAHPREGVGGVDRVPPRAVHLAALLVEHLLVAEHLAERRPPGQRDRHEELRVEPEADLLAHLRDPVGGEPLLPVARGRAGRRASARWRRRSRSPPGRTRGSPSRASRTGRCPRRARRRPPPAIRSTSAPHASQRMRISSIHGRRSSSSPSTGPVARSSSSAFEPITFRCPQEQG